MTAPFDGPRLKIARARRHVTELSEMVRAYFAREPIRIMVERPPDLDNRFKVWRARISEPHPAELSPVIGDILHNLRSALDVMACDVVRRAGKSDKGVHFPFASTESELQAMVKRWNFDRAGQECLKVLRELRPYRNGNQGLRALHDLNIQDKHQTIVPSAVGAKLDLSGVVPGATGDALDQIKNWSSKIEEGSFVVMVPIDIGLPVGAYVKAEYSLVLFIPETGLGHEIVHLLNELCRIVENIIEVFARTKN